MALTATVVTLVLQAGAVVLGLLIVLLLHCFNRTCAQMVVSEAVIEVTLWCLLLMAMALPARQVSAWASRRSEGAVAGDRRAAATRALLLVAFVVSPLAMIAISILFLTPW